MTVNCTFYEHSNFNGRSENFFLNDSWRYWWIKFGSPLRNEITSFRANAGGGYAAGNVYGFTSRDFKGDFASLNIPRGWISWWSNVGGAMNDDIESALLINRNEDEQVLEVADLIRDPFIGQLDEALAGEDVSRSGDPKIFANFWPSHDPNRKFVSIEQKLRVHINWWPDYDAKIRYDIYLYLDGNEVKGYVAWASTWVEGGIFTGKILDQLHPKVVDGMRPLNDELERQLPLLSLIALVRGPFRRLYLLPGQEPIMPPPNSNFGRIGNYAEDCCLVITF